MVARSLEGLESVELARCARIHAVKMVHRAKASHIGSALSMIDILAVLYADVLRVRPQEPQWKDRDRLVVSKGHAAVGLYSILAEVGFIPVQELENYCKDGSRLIGHVSHFVPGVELSTGSLGHGLPVACGLALGNRNNRAVCVISDGELDEGSNWEALLFAPHHCLKNLTVVVDYNKIQSFGTVDQVLRLDPLDEKLRAFGWEVREVDGHDHAALRGALEVSDRPVAVVAHTVKGKGVDFMEDSLAWHYKSPSDEDLQRALAQL